MTTAPGTRQRGTRPPGRPRGGRVVDREAMLDAAERIIRADGPDVTMEDIAAASSVTKPILYRTVGDRDAVVGALADRFVERINDAATSAVDVGAPGRDQVRQVIGSYLDFVAADRNLYLFVVTDASGDGRITRSLELADRSAIPFAASLRATGVHPSTATTWAYAFIGALQFATFRWLRDDEPSADELADQLTALLWSGIGGR